MLFITSFFCLHFCLNYYNIFLVWFLFLKFSWISIQNKCLSISWASVFQLIFFCCLFTLLFNIAEKLVLTHIKILVYLSEAVFQLSSCCCLFIFCLTLLKNSSWFMLRFLFIFDIMKFSLQHTWIMLFIFFLSFFKIFYVNQFIFFILWNFHCNTYKQYCLFFFYYFSKLFMQINLSF